MKVICFVYYVGVMAIIFSLVANKKGNPNCLSLAAFVIYAIVTAMFLHDLINQLTFPCNPGSIFDERLRFDIQQGHTCLFCDKPSRCYQGKSLI